jgi:hypothetical protein
MRAQSGTDTGFLTNGVDPMRKRPFNAALAGALAATIAFTAVPVQIIFTSSANAEVRSAKESGPKNDTYWFRNGESSNEHHKVDVWGHALDY